MTIIVVGKTQVKSNLEVVSELEHGHDAEDVADVGELDLTTAEIDTLTIKDGIQLKDDSAMAFTPSSPNGTQIPGAIYRFGRQANFGDQTAGLLDGIDFKYQLGGHDQELSVQLHPSAPCIDIIGTRDANIPWMRITDSSDNRNLFAIHDDGSLETPGWKSGILPDAYHESLAIQHTSLYIGKCELSEVNHELHVQHLKVPFEINTKSVQFYDGEY